MSELLPSSKALYKEVPSVVKPSSRLRNNLFALESLLEGNVPRRETAMLPKSRWVSYGIRDDFGNEYSTALCVGENCTSCMVNEPLRNMRNP